MSFHRPIRTDEVTGVWSFLETIDWEERWLWCLGAFHAVSFLLTVFLRRFQTLQCLLFLIYLSLVYFSEYINEIAAKNWKAFAHQQYFDSSGLFISIVFSSPLLINCAIIVLMWLHTTWNLMISAKRSQLRHQAAQEKANQEKKTS